MDYERILKQLRFMVVTTMNATFIKAENEDRLAFLTGS